MSTKKREADLQISKETLKDSDSDDDADAGVWRPADSEVLATRR